MFILICESLASISRDKREQHARKYRLEKGYCVNQKSELNAIEWEAETQQNPVLFAVEADQQAGRFSYGSYNDFLSKQTEIIEKPKEPNKIICHDPRPVAKMVYAKTEQAIKNEYNRQKSTYEAKKAEQARLNTYPANKAGYSRFVAENYPQALPFLFRRHTIPISEKNRLLHTYITGGSGSGKSEVIKSLLWHYLARNTSTALVLLTPSTKIALEVAKFPENLRNNRLIYISPALDNFRKYPCLNPFDIDGKADLSDREAERYAKEFKIVFREILGSHFTVHMETLLDNTLAVLMKLEGASIYDLLDFLEPDGSKAGFYIDFALNNFTNPNLIRFLQGSFLTDNIYIGTKSSMHTRLYSVFGSTVMQGVMIGKRTLDIEKAINQGKLIIFDISKDDLAEEWETIGKFLVAYIKILAFKRFHIEEKDRKACHVFIDECHNYITESLEVILREARKYGIHLTLAQQTVGAKMGDDLKKAVLENTGVKITGANSPYTLSKMADETGADLEALKGLSQGRFSLWRRPLQGEEQRPPLTITMPTNTLDDHHSMKANEWEALKNAQIEAFYRLPSIYHPRTTESTLDGKETPQRSRQAKQTTTKTHERQKDTSTHNGATVDSVDLSDFLS